MTSLVTIRSYHMADCPPAEAMETERALWSSFGEVVDQRPDGQTCHVLTEVAVTSDHAMEALRGAVWRRRASKIVAETPKDAA